MNGIEWVIQGKRYEMTWLKVNTYLYKMSIIYCDRISAWFLCDYFLSLSVNPVVILLYMAKVNFLMSLKLITS